MYSTTNPCLRSQKTRLKCRVIARRSSRTAHATAPRGNRGSLADRTAPVIEHTPLVLAVTSHSTTAPAVTYTTPVVVIAYAAAASDVTFVAPAPVSKNVAPVPAVTNTAPRTRVRTRCPAPAVTYAVCGRMHDHSTCCHLPPPIPWRRIVDDPISLFQEEIVKVVPSTPPELADPAEQIVDIPVPSLTTRKSWK